MLARLFAWMTNIIAFITSPWGAVGTAVAGAAEQPHAGDGAWEALGRRVGRSPTAPEPGR